MPLEHFLSLSLEHFSTNDIEPLNQSLFFAFQAACASYDGLYCSLLI